MKKTILGLLLSFVVTTTNAQWTNTGNNTTTGNLGIGTTTPVVDLQVESDIVPVDSYPPSDFKDYFKNKDYDLFYLNRDANSDIGPSIFFKGTNNATSFSARIALLGRGGANGDLAFLTSATDGYNQREVMRVTYNGNVGIGTSTPEYKLDVAGTIQGSNFFTNGTYYGTEGVRSTINPIEITSVDEVILGSPVKIELDAPNISLSNFVDINSEFVYIKNNVGIGITSPTSKLHVAYTTPDATISKNGINVSRATRTTTNVTSYDKGFFSDIRNYSIPTGITDSGYKIGVDASSFANSEEFEGTLSRNYGIWARAGIYNASPGARVINAVGVEAQVLDNIEGTTIDNVYGVRISTGNYGKATISNRYDLYASTASAKNYFAGNVGIGTTTPGDYKLAVAGSTGIIAEKVTVKLATQWPDYVFTKDYELPTLKEVEKQILEKGHLANIPSAAEVKENGIELGDMNKKLLEKIEELTLYTIQQEKKLEAVQNQKEELNTLKKENEVLKSRLSKIEAFLETLK